MLKAENVSRQYFRKAKNRNIFYAVKETDLELEAGKLTEITGRSGSGKSTLLHMLGGLLIPSAGRVLLNDTDIYSLDDEKRSRLRNSRIGIIPQGQTGLRSLTVIENVLLPCKLYGAEASVSRAEELLDAVGISDLKNAYPNELSGGEMRRLAIARALIREPEVILADEPTGDLDDENTHAVLKLLRQTADNNTAVLLVTHEKESAKYADKVYKMDNGVLTAI